MKQLIGTMEAAGVPVINFYNGNPALLPLVASAGGTALSVDWRLPLDQAWDLLGRDRAIQGNMDPAVLLPGEAPALEKARAGLDRAANRPGPVVKPGDRVTPGPD